MSLERIMARSVWKASSVFLVCLFSVTGLRAGLFEDDEARKAILDLRQRLDAVQADALQSRKSLAAENAALGQSLLDLKRQIELLRVDVSSLRGANEQLMRDLSEIQRQQKDQATALQERFSKIEPSLVQVDGVEFLAEPGEKRDYEAALAVFRKGDFVQSQKLLESFLRRYPASGYVIPALFWLGNTQYATREYQDAMANFRAMISKSPEHARAPEAMLSVANCQLELKDVKGARKSLTDLVKLYPRSEAAVAAKDRLLALK